MKLIDKSAQYLLQQGGIDGLYRQVEIAGRTCYKSEDRITEDSAKKFVDTMIKNGHTAMLEHGTVYLFFGDDVDDSYYFDKYSSSKYSVANYDKVGYVYVTTNLRVLVENGWLDDLEYLCEPTEFHEKRYAMRFVTDRGVSHELVRHRAFSFAQESQRYCGYEKDKFGGELMFVMPKWYADHKYDSYKMNEFDKMLEKVEDLYMFYRSCKMEPQEARAILPNCMKTEIVMTGFQSDWKHFFDLRYLGTTGKPHPDMLALASKAKDAFEKAGLWKGIMKHQSKFE